MARHLMDMKERGLIQNFGVTNWDVPRLVQLKDKGIVPVSNQVRVDCKAVCQFVTRRGFSLYLRFRGYAVADGGFSG